MTDKEKIQLTNLCKRTIHQLRHTEDFINQLDKHDCSFSVFTEGNFVVRVEFEKTMLNEEEPPISNMTREQELEEVKKLIQFHYGEHCCGMFFTRNVAGDSMKTLFKGEHFILEACDYWQYFELFGANAVERLVIDKFYEDLGGFSWES